eukprot:8246164-Pyramimonas_sp.AAC.1
MVDSGDITWPAAARPRARVTPTSDILCSAVAIVPSAHCTRPPTQEGNVHGHGFAPAASQMKYRARRPRSTGAFAPATKLVH